MSPSERYTRALLEARRRGLLLTAGAEALLRQAFADAIQRLTTEIRATDRVLTRARAIGLRRELLLILTQLERDVGRVTQAGVQRSITDIMAIHRTVTVRLLGSVGLRTVGVAARFDRAVVRAAAIIASRLPSASFATLYRRHLLDAAPALDRLLVGAVAQGMSSRRLTGLIVQLLHGAPVVARGLTGSALEGLRSLRYDARRIAVSETNTALREAGAQALAASELVVAVQWATSGRHDAIPHLAPDECDVLAETDFYGLGAGWYPPARFPVAPHPFCACAPSATRLRHPAEWGEPMAAPAALRVSPATMRFPPAWSRRWTPTRERRIRSTVAASLDRTTTTRTRRRAA